MRIENVTGCIADSLTINGIETIDMPINEVKNVCKILIDSTEDLGVLQSIITEVLDVEGDFEDIGQCDECGDYISKYTLEIPDNSKNIQNAYL